MTTSNIESIPGFHRHDLKEFLGRYLEGVDELPFFEIAGALPPTSKDGPWIAGGALRRTLSEMPLESDVDFFFRDEAQLTAFGLSMEAKGAWEISDKEHATTYGIKHDNETIIVQAVKMGFYPNLEAVLDSFDFTITQFGYDGQQLVCGQYSLWDLSRKRLALHKLTFGVSTIRRLIKYTKQGFTACGGVLASILEEVVANPETIHREVTYVD